MTTSVTVSVSVSHAPGGNRYKVNGTEAFTEDIGEGRKMGMKFPNQNYRVTYYANPKGKLVIKKFCGLAYVEEVKKPEGQYFKRSMHACFLRDLRIGTRVSRRLIV